MQQDLNLQQGVITLRLTFLCRSAAIRADVLARLDNGEDPFDIKDFDIDNVEIGIVSQDKDIFAAALDQLLGSGTGASYLAQMGEISALGVQDTQANREHIWQYWKAAADADATLRPKKRQYDQTALAPGTEVHFSGGYGGTGPDVHLIDEGSGHLQMIFSTNPEIWFKLNP